MVNNIIIDRHSFLEKARPNRFQKSGTEESLRNLLIGKYRFTWIFGEYRLVYAIIEDNTSVREGNDQHINEALWKQEYINEKATEIK